MSSSAGSQEFSTTLSLRMKKQACHGAAAATTAAATIGSKMINGNSAGIHRGRPSTIAGEASCGCSEGTTVGSRREEGEGTASQTMAAESLAMMKTQDERYYVCGDYLAAVDEQERRHKTGASGSAEFESAMHDFPHGDETIDAVCREKMCEWGYRVCDHFALSREIVAFSFSFLDRFVDRCSCDRTAFKLAAMTSLYVATKMLNPKQISIISLAELSRGEFSVSHIQSMERLILKTLDWRLNPPTIQSFVGCLLDFVPTEDAAVASAVQQRSTFFAELAVYDYSLVTERRLHVAIACVMNGMSGIDYGDTERCRRAQEGFLREIEGMGLLPSPHSREYEEVISAIADIQNQVWFLYTCSEQQLEDDDNGIGTGGSRISSPLHRFSRHLHGVGSGNKVHSNILECLAHSPVSVNNIMRGANTC